MINIIIITLLRNKGFGVTVFEGEGRDSIDQAKKRCSS